MTWLIYIYIDKRVRPQVLTALPKKEMDRGARVKLMARKPTKRVLIIFETETHITK